MPAADGPAPSALRTVAQAATLGVVYVAAVGVATAISVPNVTIAPIRLPNAFAITALLLTPPSTWWLYLLAIVPRHLYGFPDWTIGARYLAANSIEILIAAAAVRRIAGSSPRLDSLRETLIFLLAAVVVAPMSGAVVGAWAVHDIYPAIPVAAGWRFWFLGDAVGNVAIVPALLALSRLRTRARRPVTGPRIAEAVLVGAGIVLGSLPTLGVFGSMEAAGTTALSMLYVPFPLLVWSALRFGPNGAAAANMLLASLAVMSALQGRGPFGELDNRSGVVLLQQFLIVTGATALIVAAVAQERRRTLAALRDSENRYRSLLDTATDVVLTIDFAGRIETANQAFEEVTGWTPADWLDRPVTSFLPDEEVDAARTVIDSLRRGGPAEMREWRIRTKSGGLRIGEVKLSLFTRGGQPAGVLVIGRDITERRRAEAERSKLEDQMGQVRKLEAVGQLAGGIAHDFNNILQAILGFADLARGEVPPDTPVADHLDKVVTSAERAQTLTRQLLTFSRREQVTPKLLDLVAIIGEFNRILRRVLPANINLSLTGLAGAPYVVADRSHIEQIVMNLCVNAADAMPDGGTISVTVDREDVTDTFAATHSWARPGEFVTIAVADTGTGIAADLLPHIFEPFFTTKEIGKGTGLGLATVYGIVQRYEGLIDVQSTVGRGTTFRIYLPAHDAAAAADEERRERLEGARGRNELILVAEDEPLVRALAVSQLEGAGYRVLEAEDGETALRLFNANAADVKLAFLDVMMPRGDGRSVSLAIRAKRPALPILFATGYADRDRSQTTLQMLGSPIIEKPYAMGLLLSKVRELLDASVVK